MPILNRLSSLLFADVHAVLDKLEDPHTSLNLSVREMEASLADTGQEISTLRLRAEKQQQQRSEIVRRIASFDEELNVCFSSSEEDLAKTVLRKKLNCENTLASMNKLLNETEQNLQSLQALYVENERQLVAMREKLALYSTESANEADTPSAPYETVSDEAVEVAFLREKQRRQS